MESVVNKIHLNEDTTHVVILFISNNEKEKKNVELVPRSWLAMIDSKFWCYYPNESEYGFISKWVAENKEPDGKNWQMFEIKIVKEILKNIIKNYISDFNY